MTQFVPGKEKEAHEIWKERVSKFSDSKLQAFAASKRFSLGFQKLITPILAEELEKRGLEPNYAWFRRKCSLCEAIPLYRVGDNAFCGKHINAAKHMRKAALIDYVARTRREKRPR